jgi:hypothetical protein
MWNFVQTNIVGFLGVLLGLLGLFIFRTELRMRREMIDANTKKQQEEQERQLEFSERELKLHTEKFKAEEKDRERKNNWLDTQHATLQEMSLSLSENIAARLRRDSSWATEALERTKLGPYADTLFGERKNHFRDEKELIAQRFVPLLLQRCKWLSNQGTPFNQVYLCIDSGTTLYPIFRELGLEMARAYQRGEEWIKNKSITIVTNNLPGLEALMEHGRINPADRFSSLAVNCKVLPGSPLPIYSAITGKDTEEELQKIKDSSACNSVFIALVTGNWVRIRRHSPRCPVPLSRGSRHPEFKQKLIDICNEIYVISPLGKIFAQMSETEVNTMLHLDPAYSEPAKKAYQEAQIDDDKAKNIKLISTWRERGRLLASLSDYLGGDLRTTKLENNDEAFLMAAVGETSHIQFRFDLLPRDSYLEKEVEFPHPHTRKDEFTERFIKPQTIG